MENGASYKSVIGDFAEMENSNIRIADCLQVEVHYHDEPLPVSAPPRALPASREKWLGNEYKIFFREMDNFNFLHVERGRRWEMYVINNSGPAAALFRKPSGGRVMFLEEK